MKKILVNLIKAITGTKEPVRILSLEQGIHFLDFFGVNPDDLDLPGLGKNETREDIVYKNRSFEDLRAVAYDDNGNLSLRITGRYIIQNKINHKDEGIWRPGKLIIHYINKERKISQPNQ